MQKLLVLASMAIGLLPLATPKNVVHGLYVPPGPIPAPTTGGHLTGNEDRHLVPRNHALGQEDPESVDQLLDLLHVMYGNDVGRVIQNPRWLEKICLRACAPFDWECQNACINPAPWVEYIDLAHILRCASQCEHLDHQNEEDLSGEYGACLAPCLVSPDIGEEKNVLESPFPTQSQTSSPLEYPTAAVESPFTSSTSVQSYPYKATQISVDEIIVFDIVGPAPPLTLSETTSELKGVNGPITTTSSEMPLFEDMTSAMFTTASTAGPIEPTYPSQTLVPTSEIPSAPYVTATPTPISHAVFGNGTAMNPDLTKIYEAIDPIPFYPGDDEELDLATIDAMDGLSELDAQVNDVQAPDTEDDYMTALPSFAIYTGINGTLTTETLAVPAIHPTAVVKFGNVTTGNATTTTSSTLSTGAKPSSTTTLAGFDLAGGASIFELPFHLKSSAVTLLAAVIGFGLIMG
ncbi:hypothetical protein DFH27DRAFT_33073 [Peziza echinospora]|nr:hypothetical protein DFH27DRAFT_33073 [Peziza echinospora]